MYNKTANCIDYRQTFNQDQLSDRSTAGATMIPLMNIDTWEHAYYLDYNNRRPAYLAACFKILNWEKIAERLAAAKENWRHEPALSY